MNYYPHHIGDFDRATRHLTRVERSVYRDLMDVYYDTEAALTLDQAALCRKVLARSPEEAKAVADMLLEFFHETPTGWFHDRCEEELENYRKSNSQKSAAGKASAAARATRREQALSGTSTVVEQPLNGRSISVDEPYHGSATNQEPRTKNQNQENLVQPGGSTQDHVSLEKKGPIASDEDFECARWLFGRNVIVNPGARPPNYTTWANDVRLMNRIDGRSHRQICELYQWAKADSFWSANIQSPAKLREKWDQLAEKRQALPPAPKVNLKLNPNNQDRSGDAALMIASMKRHGIEPDGPIEDFAL